MPGCWGLSSPKGPWRRSPAWGSSSPACPSTFGIGAGAIVSRMTRETGCVLAAFLLGALAGVAHGESREATAVFRKWLERQSIRVDVDLGSWKKGLGAERLRKVRERMPAALRSRMRLDGDDDKA